MSSEVTVPLSDSPPPADRFCDLVMKGGITSGVVYPKAIVSLSRHYRFKSIGGTSAGAIAAAVTAAAEYQRRTTGSTAGFDLLDTLPERLGTTLPGSRRSKLLSLFQPQPGGTRRLFSVLIRALNASGTWDRVWRIGSGLLWAYWPVTLVALLLGVLVGRGVHAVTGVLALLILVPVAVGLAVYRDLTRATVANGFGLCTGMAEDGSSEALTPWLHALIQQAAGEAFQRQGKPLTFGDLWTAQERPEWFTGKTWRAIDLQMFTTNLSHGRPYVFPLPEKSAVPSRFRAHDRLYFRPSELKRYLPPDVLASMCIQPYVVEPGREDKDPPADPANDLFALPEPKDLPVLFAARMSLSFPLLFAAVPLHAIDHDPPGRHPMRRCWFSDGGISSNFPMHLFDGLVPAWPTFGINLENKIEGRAPVYLPPRYDKGHGERWSRFADQARSASRFGGFLSAIVGTMQNWNDNSLARMPGVRDRIARVRLDASEGGLNLDMASPTIQALAARGVDAAEALIQHFGAAAPGNPPPSGWEEHRFVRLNTLLCMMQELAPSMAHALDPQCAHVTDFPTLFASLRDAPTSAPGYEQPLSQAQLDALLRLIGALADFSHALQDPSNEVEFKPIPGPKLRVRPPL